jgi:CHAD domain-containing protein
MMSELPRQFGLPAALGIPDVITKLTPFLRTKEAAKQRVQRIYYDTFDWRLHERGFALALESNGVTKHLQWSALDEPATCLTVETVEMPRFAWDFPEGNLRTRLKKTLGLRALLPQVEIRFVRYVADVLDGREKTVVRLVFEATDVLGSADEVVKPLEPRLRIEPVKGFTKRFDKTCALLQSVLPLVPVTKHILSQTLQALGRNPRPSVVQPSAGLDPEMRADQATKLILQHLLETMQINEAGVRGNLDSEFLHDFRVAVRRTRSALGQVKRVFPDRVIKRFAPRFAWLGAITTPARDLDVHLLRFDDLRMRLPEPMQKDLDPLYAFLKARSEESHRELARHLDSSAYRKLMRSWKDFLEAPVPRRSRLACAARPIREVAAQRILKLYRKALKQGHAITPETPAEYLHELRKTCKKLRYLMEFFQSLFPLAKIKELLKTLKELQGHLGAFQDTQVQIESIGQFSQEMLADGRIPAQTFLVMGVLIDRLYASQQVIRSEFADHFEGFASQETLVCYKSLFARAGDAASC